MSHSDTVQIQNYSYSSIAKGSLSFSFASRLFSQNIRDHVVKLYAWCRYVDDQIDDDAISKDQKFWRLENISHESFASYPAGRLAPGILAFRTLLNEKPFPLEYPNELLEGMRMDLDGRRYETLKDLELYCYRVAGVVGLMMSYVMGVKSERAYAHARDLGMAMQLTNIARDVLTDAGMGRIYLPLSALREQGLTEDPKTFTSPEAKAKLAVIVRSLLLEAETLYKSGDDGLKYLNWRSAVAIAMAREIYSAIGRKVLKKGSTAWDSRCYVPFAMKLVYAFKGLAKAIFSRFQPISTEGDPV